MKALNFFPDDVPQVAEYTVEEIGEFREYGEKIPMTKNDQRDWTSGNEGSK